MQKYTNTLTDFAGNGVKLGAVTVRKEDGTLASLFSDRHGTKPIANPVIADLFGVFSFYAPNGRYKLSVSAAGYSGGIADDVLLFDPADAGIGDAVPASVVQNTPSANVGASTVQGAIDELGSKAAAAQQKADTADNKATAAQQSLADLGTGTDAAKGAKLVGYDGGSVQDVLDNAKALADYAELRAYTGRATLVRITANGIAGVFARSATDTTSADNGGTVIVDGAGRRWLRQFTGPVMVEWFGADPSGQVNSSSAIQAAINAGRGKEVRAGAGTWLVAGLTLNGASYNNTKLIFEGTFKLAPSGGAATYLDRWLGVLVKDCEDVTVELRDADGNRANQPATEHIHIMGLAGVKRFNGGRFKCREIRGDGIYLSQSNWNANSAQSEDVIFDSIEGYNSADDGRNLLSVIAVSGLTVGEFTSIRIGGVIGAVRQPGGLDIEPNWSYQVCENIKIGSARIISAGVAGLAVIGKAPDVYGQFTSRNISLGNFSVTKTVGVSGTMGVLTRNCADVSGSGDVYCTATAAQGQSGVFVDRATGVNLDVNAYGCSVGARIGETGYVYDSHVHVNARVYHESAALVTGAVRTKVTGKAALANNTNTYAVRFKGYARQTLTLSSVSGTFSIGETVAGGTSGATAQVVDVLTISGTVYMLLAGASGAFSGGETVTGGTSGATASAAVIALACVHSSVSVDAPKLTGDQVARGYRNEPTDAVTAINVRLEDADLTGYGSFSAALENCGAGFVKQRLLGVTNSGAVPGNGTWRQGDFVWRDNNSALDINSMFILGWMRLTNGSNHTVGTDWAIARVSHVSPAA